MTHKAGIDLPMVVAAMARNTRRSKLCAAHLSRSMSWSPIAPERCLPMPDSVATARHHPHSGRHSRSRETGAGSGRRKASGPHHHLACRTHQGTRPARRRNPHRRLRRRRRAGGYIRDTGITQLIDATHPFARQISANAVEAARLTGVPLDIRTRKPWVRQPGDIWIEVDTLEQARDAIPSGARVLLALGSQHIGLFASRDDVHFVVRMIDPPELRWTCPITRWCSAAPATRQPSKPCC
jgi:hypothetical protein